MAFNRELSQFAAYLDLDAAGNYIGITPAESTTNVGIGVTNPSSKLQVEGDVRISGVTTSIGGFVGDLTGNADTASALESSVTISLEGDVAGSIAFDGSQNVSIAATIQPNSVALGDDTTGNYVATIADSGNTNITVNNSGTENAEVTLDLTDTTVSAGSYGSSTEIPTFTVDAKGRLTAAGTASVGTALTVSGDSGSEDIDLLTESLSISGGTNLTSVAANNGVTVNLDSDINLDSVTATGIITATGGFEGDLTGNADTATALETARTFEITGDVVATTVSFDGTGNVSLAATIQPNSVALGDDTTGNYVATIADAGNTNITVNNSGSETADVTLDLTDTTVSAGSYGSSTEIPTFTVDAKGRLTAAGTAAVGTALTVAGDSGSEVINLLSETLTISGDTHVTTAADSDTVTISVDATSDNTNNAIVARNSSGGFSAGIITASQVLLGAEGSALHMKSDRITGPSTIILDPAAVGDDTGLVVIKGDLQVDGTQTIINSTTVTVEDKNIQIADGAANDAAADGAGFTVNSGDGNKTFQFNDANDSFQANISLDVASGEVYKIDGTEVLSADTLGSGVVNSSLTSVGTLGQLEVSGVSTFTSAIDANGDLDVDGHTELDDLNVAGVSTFASNVDINASVDISSNLNVSGVTTSTGGFVGDLTGDVTGNADTATALETARTFELTGDVVGSAVSFDGTGNVSIAATIQPNSVALGDDTTGNYVATIADSGNTNITVNNSGTENADVTLDLTDTTVSAGSYGSGSEIPTFTVDAKGRLTAAGTVAVSTGMTVAGDSGSEVIDLLSETLTIAGGTNLTSSAASDTVTVNLDSDINLDSVTATGIITATGGFDGDLTGDVTGNADTATALETARTFELTGDVVGSAVSFDGTGNVSIAATIQPNSVALGDDTTGNYVATIADAGNTNITVNNSGSETADVTLDLTDTTVSAGSYGSSTEIPTFTVDAKGRLTAAGTAAVGTALTVAGDSGSEIIDLLSESLTIAGGTNLTSSAASDTVTINLDENISLTNVNASGIVTATGGFDGDLTGDVTGNADTATALETARTFEITGDVVGSAISFDGTGNVSIAATIQPNSVALGDDTTGNYVATIADSGDSDVVVNNSGSETAGVTLGLTTTGVSAGSYGSSTEIPTFTVDSRGRLTAAGTASVGTALTVAGDSGSEVINLLSETLTISGGTNLTSSAASDTVTVNLDDNISLDSVTATGIITAAQFVTGASGEAIGINTNTISGPETLVLDPAAVGDNTGTVVIKGDLQVDGTQTIINSTTVTVEDKNIQIADGAANDAAADGAGITVNSGDGDKTFQFSDANDSFQANIALDVTSGNVYKIDGTEVLSADTLGSGVVNSSLTSVGTLGQLNVTGVTTSTGGFDGDLTGDVTGNADTATALETSRTFEITGDVVASAISFDGTGNVSFAATIQPNSVALGDDTTGNYVATIADAGNTNITVNNSGTENAGVTLDLTDTTVSAGSYGSSTEIPTFTVDAKGRLTAAGTASVGTALTVAGDSGSEVINLLNESLTIAGGTNLTSSAASDTVTVNLDDNISLDSVTATGIITATGGFDGNLTGNVTGNLNSSGLSTVTNLEVSGYISAGSTTGANEQVMMSTGVGVTWTTIADILPEARTGLTTTASDGQTAFSFEYNVNYLDVFVNGVKLSNSDFTATNGSDITLTEGAFAGDKVEFISYSTVGTGSGSVNSLNDLSDVSLGSQSAGDIIAYDGSGFVNQQSLNLSGIVTASEFYGDGSNLTGIDSTALKDAGGNVKIQANESGAVLTGILTATGAVEVGGNLTVTGDLTVDGTTTTINSTTLTVDDLNIVVASGAADAASADGAGLTVDGANATFTYASTGDKFVSNKDIHAPNFNSTSDRNLKDNIRPVEGASELVGKLEGVHFTWKSNGQETIGVIAQQIEEHLPQLVHTGDDHKSVNYNGLIGVLIEAVKEQGQMISALQAEIEELKK